MMNNDNFHIDHCSSCIKFKKCLRNKRCPVVSCRLRCGHWMHECKAFEHQDLCPKVMVPCINYENGCPRRLLRKDLNMHLTVCPASVVRCNAQWCRWKLRQPQSGRKAVNLDVTHELSEGLVISDEDLISRRYPGFHCSLDLGIEYLPYSHTNTPIGLETFECGQHFRRDQYSSHYKVVHSDIFGSLRGFWLDARCPLFSYGCNYSVNRLKPSLRATETKESRVLFSGLLRAFTVYSQTLIKPAEEEDAKNLPDMPVEILEKIFGFLDGCSLNNLALTSKHMRDVSRLVMSFKGIVILKWALGQNGRWVFEEQWLFPNCFDEDPSWSLILTTQALSQHLNKCPFNERLVQTKPFKLCSLPNLRNHESRKTI